jgi:4-carboxymuconolactone decarboxylase
MSRSTGKTAVPRVDGLSKEEVGEIIIQLTPYLGFPLTVSAAAAVGDVVERAKI